MSVFLFLFISVYSQFWVEKMLGSLPSKEVSYSIFYTHDAYRGMSTHVLPIGVKALVVQIYLPLNILHLYC